MTATVHRNTQAASAPLEGERLARAKKAYTTRFAARSIAAAPSGYRLLTGPSTVPAPGDIVLARVESIGQLKRLESPDSRRQFLFEGDEVLLAYGHRYAADNVLAEVPGDLGPCHLVAAGGIAGSVTASHGDLAGPTRLVPQGIVADARGRLTLSRFAPRQVDPAAIGPVAPHVIAVLGTSMNAGKSTSAACLVKGLAASGLRVAAGKATGTGAGGDPWLFADAGASPVLDFTDFGYPSTFRLAAEELGVLAANVVSALAESAPDVIVVEIADGVYQEETRRLLADPVLHSLVDSVIFAAADALGASAGVALLRDAGLPPAAVSGVVTASPLASAEAAGVLDIPVIGTRQLAEPRTAQRFLGRSTA
ncbi:DUF1611 domain-containing protein [Sinomonas halotolerans]|uniref:DUF1611 domain-containing protein n=1 Tax=Sinomonas halotolerans TaxID=1644133 RepID=A0ABU9WXQ5_9MICC